MQQSSKKVLLNTTEIATYNILQDIYMQLMHILLHDTIYICAHTHVYRYYICLYIIFCTSTCGLFNHHFCSIKTNLSTVRTSTLLTSGSLQPFEGQSDTFAICQLHWPIRAGLNGDMARDVPLGGSPPHAELGEETAFQVRFL